MTDKVFKEQWFLWESEASVSADFDLFIFQDLLHAQEWEDEKSIMSHLSCDVPVLSILSVRSVRQLKIKKKKKKLFTVIQRHS